MSRRLPDDFVTVDAASTRDIDDAFTIETNGDGLTVWVAIAAPALAIPIDSPEDREARALGATRYGGPRVLQAMLPPMISEGSCTLQAGVDRPAMVMRIEMSANLEPELAEVLQADIRVAQRLTYEDVPRLAADAGPMQPMLARAIQLGTALLDARRRDGGLAFFDAVRFLYANEEGTIKQATSKGDMVGHIVIQELMILTNRLLAAWAIRQDLPFLYRNHQTKLATPPAADLAQQLLVQARDAVTTTDLLMERMRTLMGTADYGAVATGHYALHLPQYSHSTSPLRRYADLVNQRQVFAHISGQTPPYSQGQLHDLVEPLNATLTKAKEDRALSMKQATQRRASRALGAGRLASLGSPELVQAIKLSARAGAIPIELEDFLIDRMESNRLEDKVLDALVEASTFGKAYSPTLLLAWSRLMATRPEHSKHFLMFAVQTLLAEAYSSSERAVAGGFEVTVRLRRAHDRFPIEVKAVAGRKKDADNLASARAMCAFVGSPDLVRDAPAAVAAPAPALAPAPPAITGNPKGALLETCQKRKWPMPEFECTQVGPSNAPVFSCTVRVRAPAQPFEGASTGHSTRKAAEAAAAADALRFVA